jgi:hypothetical protein
MADINLNDIHVVQKADTESVSLPKPANQVKEYHSDSDIADLELLANAKKTKQKSISMQQRTKSRDNKSETSSDRRFREKSKKHVQSVSRRSDSESVPIKPKHRKKTVTEENEDYDIRQEKTRLLGFLDTTCRENKRSYRYDMTYSVEELRDNLKNEQAEASKLSGTAFLKQGLKFVTTGIEWGNNRFDPVGLKLNGWSKSIAVDIDAEKFDRVLYKLYEKYGMSSGMGPEMELAFMMLQSVLFFHISASVRENPAQLSSLMNMFSSGSVDPPKPKPQQQQQQEPQFQPQTQTQTQTQTQPQPQPQPQARPWQQPVQQKPQFQRVVQDESDSDTSDDLQPSKIPEQDYQDILQKMRSSNPKVLNVDLPKESLPEPRPPKRKPGRPRKIK